MTWTPLIDVDLPSIHDILHADHALFFFSPWVTQKMTKKSPHIKRLVGRPRSFVDMFFSLSGNRRSFSPGVSPSVVDSVGVRSTQVMDVMSFFII